MQPALCLHGATIHVSPAEAPVHDGTVLIEDGTISAVGRSGSLTIPPAARRIDCAGRTITAGFWNSHVHFFERKWADAASTPADELGRQLQDMLTRYGFTSVFDTGSLWVNTRRLRDRIESGEIAGPRIRSTGEGLIPPGALPTETVLNMMGAMNFPPPEVLEPQEAAAAAISLLESGVDAIKLFASSPRSSSLPVGTIAAAVKEARRFGKPVFIHPNSGADVLSGVRGGVDIIAHTTPHTGPWDETILAEMKDAGVALTPTLTIWKHYMRHDRISAQERVTNTELDQVRAWLAAGGTVLFGNDLGAVDYDPSDEYALMAQAGMSYREILASLTTTPAERFGDGARAGRVAAGLQADLVVLRDDPARNLRALTSVECTIRAGRIIYQASD
jgi:imidazolonepropionase-like amidohydrolase